MLNISRSLLRPFKKPLQLCCQSNKWGHKELNSSADDYKKRLQIDKEEIIEFHNPQFGIESGEWGRKELNISVDDEKKRLQIDKTIPRQIPCDKEDKIVEFYNPQSDTELTSSRATSVFVPTRIRNEENAMESGYCWDRLSEKGNFADWNSLLNYPYNAKIKDPHFYFQQKRQKDYQKLVDSQLFIRERLTTLGPDLSACMFLITRGCKIRLKGYTNWFEQTINGYQVEYPEELPISYEPGYYVEAIDMSDSKIVYEGLTNIRNLVYLKYLNISYCMEVDVWCMDRITGEFTDSLEYLDLSGCRNLNWNGLECIWRLYRLKTLVLRDMDHIKDLKLICLMLLDILPNLEIRGVDYLDTSLLEGAEEEALLKDSDLYLLPDGVENKDGQNQ